MNLRNTISTHARAFVAVILPALLLSCSSGAMSEDTDRPADVPAAGSANSTLSADEHCAAVKASVEDAGFDDEASVTCDDSHARIHSDSYPSHDMMNGIVGTNEQIPLPAPGYFAPIVLEPAFHGSPQTRDSSLAIAVNGIPIFDYSSGGEMSVDDLYYHQPHLDTVEIEQLDDCGGHTGRGDDYHYHEEPRCMIEQMQNKNEHPIIGWGFDGFPLYGNYNPDGSSLEPAALDVCNGQLDSVFGYRYHATDEQPYIVQCLVGVVGDLSKVPTIGMGRPPGIPVKVENLRFSNDDLGNGLLTYEYKGNEFYLKSTATEKPECFDVEWKTVTNGGVVDSGEYCHFIRTEGGRRRGPGGGGMGGPGGGGMGGPGGGGMGPAPTDGANNQ